MTDTLPENPPEIPNENRVEVVLEASATVTKADGTVREEGDFS